MLATLALRRRLKQLADLLVPPQIAMLDLGEGVGGVQIAATIAELGIADVLADGPKSAHEIAARIDCDEDTTHRLLRGAVGCGLCTMDHRTGAVKLTRTGAVLRSDHPSSLRAWMRYKGMRSTVDAWGGLAASVRSGRSAFELVHGMSVWEWFAAHPDEQRSSRRRCGKPPRSAPAPSRGSTRGRTVLWCAMSSAASARCCR
ncbi:hypothetical protein AU184_25970 [Mycolicibacterium novocastrense]|nr:hypothetical protein AU072_18325 [Mycolicibacterium novocastrense]KUH71180.1 hypothetical protein AU183_20250 [Mycolicibacterium novocastrense]KUH73303.1 hypothetical protein AU184_25970 [Mycolicibacterium novocastrense]